MLFYVYRNTPLNGKNNDVYNKINELCCFIKGKSSEKHKTRFTKKKLSNFSFEAHRRDEKIFHFPSYKTMFLL